MHHHRPTATFASKLTIMHNMRQFFDLMNRIIAFPRGRIVTHITGTKTDAQFKGPA